MMFKTDKQHNQDV